MKKALLLTSLVFSMAITAAPSQKYFDAIKKSKELKLLIKEGNIVESIIHLEFFKASGCHKFAVYYKNPEEDCVKSTIFYTRKTQFNNANILVFRKNPKVSTCPKDFF